MMKEKSCFSEPPGSVINASLSAVVEPNRDPDKREQTTPLWINPPGSPSSKKELFPVAY